jgi:hypothetical protein
MTMQIELQIYQHCCARPPKKPSPPDGIRTGDPLFLRRPVSPATAGAKVRLIHLSFEPDFGQRKICRR